MGRMASRIETAPRRPTQATKPVSRWVYSNGSRHSHTASGRAMKTRNTASAIAGRAICGNCDGVASRPSTRNMMICASHVMPSWKRRIEVFGRIFLLPV